MATMDADSDVFHLKQKKTPQLGLTGLDSSGK
jgi:hypothetical protein